MKLLGALATALIVVLLMRSTVLAGFAVRGVVLDAMAFATVVWGLRQGAGWGATFGFFLGLCADLDAAHWLGRHALALTLIGYLVGRLSGSVVGGSSRAQFALLLIATAAHQTWAGAFGLAGAVTWPDFAARIALGSTATGVAGIAVLGVLRRLGGRSQGSHVGLSAGKTL